MIFFFFFCTRRYFLCVTNSILADRNYRLLRILFFRRLGRKKKKPDEKAEAAADDCCMLLQLPFNRLNNCAPYTRTEIIVFCITKDVLSGRNEANLCEIVLPNFDQRETVFTEKWIEKWRVIMQLPSFAPLP